MRMADVVTKGDSLAAIKTLCQNNPSTLLLLGFAKPQYYSHSFIKMQDKFYITQLQRHITYPSYMCKVMYKTMKKSFI